MTSTDLVPSSPGDSSGSALRDFLSHAVIYGNRALMPRDLVQFGLMGSGLAILASVIALALPDPASIEHAHGPMFHAHFFLILGSVAGGLVGLLQALAVPAIVCGVMLLGLDIYFMRVPTTEEWRWAIVGQAAAGGLGAGIGILFFALLILNVVVWLVIVVFIAAACLMALAALLGMIGGG